MKIVFMGTPEFSVGCFEAIIEAGHEVSAVFSQPDKQKGRGMKMSMPPVKEAALKHGITVYQPHSLRDGDAFKILNEISPDIIVVVAYGKLLPKEILELPKYGCVNVHASVLPKYRGASPIQWSIVQGESETGVSTMLMDEGMDTGDVLEIKKIKIEKEDNAGSLHDKLAILGAEVLISTLKGLEKGTITPKKQEGNPSYAPIINKEMGRLDFTKSAEELFNLIRGFNPWPVSFTELDGKRLKVFTAEIVDASGKCGEVLESNGRLTVACGEGALALKEVQLEGSRRMGIEELLRGHPIKKGIIF